jgi:hypothetical protein
MAAVWQKWNRTTSHRIQFQYRLKCHKSGHNQPISPDFDGPEFCLHVTSTGDMRVFRVRVILFSVVLLCSQEF